MKPVFRFLILLMANVQILQFAYPQNGVEKKIISKSKPSIDLNAIKNWPGVGSGQISNDGNYVSYWVYNDPPKSKRLIVRSSNSEWQKMFQDASMELFLNDCKHFIFKTGDSLCLQTLGQDQKNVLDNVSEFQVSPDPLSAWLAYRKTKQPDILYLRYLKNAKETLFKDVSSFQFSPDGKSIILQEKDNAGGKIIVKIKDLGSGKENIVWESTDQKIVPQNIELDNGNDGIAVLLSNQGEGDGRYSIWYYNRIRNKGKIIVADSTLKGKIDGMQIANRSPRFSDDGKRIYFGLEIPKRSVTKLYGVAVDVWSYKDSVLQSQQLEEVKKQVVYASVVNTDNGLVIRLENENEKIVGESIDFILVEKRLGLNGMFEASWNKSAQFSYSLISLKGGSRKLIKKGIINPYEALTLSPSGQWVIYYDFQQKCYFSYETTSGETKAITKGVNVNWEDEDNDFPEPGLRGWPVWLADDKAFLVYDSYDIWIIDPSGKSAPKNWTNGYGRKNDIKFTLIDPPASFKNYLPSSSEPVFLKAFEKNTKNCGYYKKYICKNDDPELRTMGPYLYGGWDRDYSANFPPIKSKNSHVYLDLRCSASEAPNYFITRDFKKFKFLTDIRPQNLYNWYTTELHSWQSSDGSILQGILYKPTNFDSTKKYPVIFLYYEKRSYELNLYIRPSVSRNEINIPSFVSKGYLVFVPDIHYTIGKPGESAFNAVASAANYLAKKPWVNREKMGLQGHSFGGFETGYIITHTDLFAAACSASGIYDLISSYTSAARAGYPMYHAERNQGRLGGTLWEIRNLYIENSPIFRADKVTTPILMMQNKEDRTVPFAQGIEFFTALRRLGKKVWMLQYDNEDHSLESFDAAFDFSTRMMQFFDHYLKDAPTPKWMTKGIPAQLKGIEDGFQLDANHSNQNLD